MLGKGSYWGKYHTPKTQIKHAPPNSGHTGLTLQSNIHRIFWIYRIATPVTKRIPSKLPDVKEQRTLHKILWDMFWWHKVGLLSTRCDRKAGNEPIKIKAILYFNSAKLPNDRLLWQLLSPPQLLNCPVLFCPLEFDVCSVKRVQSFNFTFILGKWMNSQGGKSQQSIAL